MGGKGRRRRENNYRAAHGGYSALPPPPDPSQVDALPSKLRRIIAFSSSPQSQSQGTAALTKNIDKRKKREGGHVRNDKDEAETADVKGDTEGQLEASQHTDSGSGHFIQSNASEKKKKKRNRKEVKDLRFEEVEKTSTQLKRRERKKNCWEAKKKKQKKTKEEENLDFPGHEQIKFGDIVEAPPKLASLPKAFKNAQDASQERLRLKAIEAYRNRKGWTSRPGSHLLPPVTASTC
ncbi:hypothetical protein L6164_003739 [Bauhinia variegata]|uniref:Uncharacterized protein n=1 Tax=Bauhinia variegata TaxID=167791 RepID=A0ACB9Q1D1_BAUVA|nr:hypothetical protein L6164_003739 [Bauhinia variegata]